MSENRKKVLILCTGNSCRSQMAEGLINHFLHDEWIAYSAGVSPTEVNPLAVKVMTEIDIDISNHRSKSVDEFLGRSDLDLVVTVCDNAKESCPIFPANVNNVHIGFEDPADYTDKPEAIALAKFREVRDDIKKRLLDFLENYHIDI